VLSSPLVFFHRKDLGVLASKRRLPAVSMFTESAEAGALMAYGPNLRECFRRAGGFVGRILKGAKAGDLPVERPETFELVINRTTAKTLSLTVPQALISRADRIVD
jgi:putative ABC transport system substrate-binding protein